MSIELDNVVTYLRYVGEYLHEYPSKFGDQICLRSVDEGDHPCETSLVGSRFGVEDDVAEASLRSKGEKGKSVFVP